MNHRFPLPVDHARAPVVCSRTTVALALAVAFVAGCFTGAILFGVKLLELHAS